MSRTGAAERVDGRLARSERTRRAIVDAHLALIEAGDLKPTGERIAERAGVSLRTLWANFNDMEKLFAACGERLAARMDAEHEPIQVDLPLTRRIDLFCRQRARMLEILAPSARAARTREPFSAALRRNHVAQLGKVEAEIAELFAHELDAIGRNREELLHALVAGSTFGAWSELRDSFGLDVEQARRVMARTVTALLSAAIATSLEKPARRSR
jgi:TetR/AcrR family transcriptional regulator of autoinduction and epiphytic fitness